VTVPDVFKTHGMAILSGLIGSALIGLFSFFVTTSIFRAEIQAQVTNVKTEQVDQKCELKQLLNTTNDRLEKMAVKQAENATAVTDIKTSLGEIKTDMKEMRREAFGRGPLTSSK